MSMCYWMCEGIGVRSSDIYSYLNKERCFNEIQKCYPDEELSLEDFDIEDYLYGDFQHLGDFLCQLDESGVLTYTHNGDDESYLLYAPLYPWQITEADPHSVEEARELIKRVVLRVCDIDEETLEKIIDNDIYEYGCG